MIRRDLGHAEPARLLATGCGVLGTCLQYIETLAAPSDALGIHDPDVADLLTETRRHPQILPADPGQTGPARSLDLGIAVPPGGGRAHRHDPRVQVRRGESCEKGTPRAE